MMSFKKLLLVSAVAALSSSAFAMESMDESALADTTGQDGFDITLSTKLTGLTMYIHDTDGFTGQTGSGAIVLTGVGIDNGAGGNAGVKVVIDAGAPAAGPYTTTSPVLQVGISTTTTTKINLGSLAVAKSNRTTGWGLIAGTTTGTLMNLGSITIGATANLLNIQMGNEPQGAWMLLNATITGGVSLTNFTLNDAGGAISGGGIGVGTLTMLDTGGGANLTTSVKVDANTSGLQLGLTQVGTLAGGMDIRMQTVKLGDTSAAGKSIGDIEVVGLNLAGSTVTITGH